MIDIAIDLVGREATPNNPTAWAAALATGRKVLASQVAYEAATKAAFIAPLLRPKIKAAAPPNLHHDTTLWDTISCPTDLSRK